jgi:hypothetical protein
MSELYESLAHSKWNCKYVVFVPKRRRKAIFGQTRRQLGAIFHALARQKECQIIEGHLMPVRGGCLTIMSSITYGQPPYARVPGRRCSAKDLCAAANPGE